jgi:hypothetical protein
VFLIIAALPLTACAQKSAAASNPKPAVVEPIEGSEFKRVVVTEKAAQRLDIQTAQVSQEQVNGTRRLAVPYAAVIYGLHGETWVYTNPESLAFVRAPITVDTIDGDTAPAGWPHWHCRGNGRGAGVWHWTGYQNNGFWDQRGSLLGRTVTRLPWEVLACVGSFI